MLKVFILSLTFLSVLNATIEITPTLKAKAHALLKEIKPIKGQKITPKQFITAAVLSTGLKRYSVSSYISKDFSNGQAVFDEPEFYRKECFDPNKYSNINIDVVERKIRDPFLFKIKNYKCQYNTKSIKEIKKLVDVFFDYKLHNENVMPGFIGILPIGFDDDVPIKTLITPQYQYENLDIEYLEYPITSSKFKKTYRNLWN